MTIRYSTCSDILAAYFLYCIEFVCFSLFRCLHLLYVVIVYILFISSDSFFESMIRYTYTVIYLFHFISYLIFYSPIMVFVEKAIIAVFHTSGSSSPSPSSSSLSSFIKKNVLNFVGASLLAVGQPYLVTSICDRDKTRAWIRCRAAADDLQGQTYLEQHSLSSEIRNMHFTRSVNDFFLCLLV